MSRTTFQVSSPPSVGKVYEYHGHQYKVLRVIGRLRADRSTIVCELMSLGAKPRAGYFFNFTVDSNAS
jgi:hypothetical protein